MPLTTMRSLLLAAGLSWALFPYWGGLGFGIAYLLLLVTVLSKRHSAKKKLAGHADQLALSLPSEAMTWANKYPLYYVWPEAARGWALTMKGVSLLMGVLILWFVVRGVVFLQPSVWLCLIPAAAVLAFGLAWGDRLDLEVVLAAKHRPLHDEVKKVLALQALAGKWAPGDPG